MRHLRQALLLAHCALPGADLLQVGHSHGQLLQSDACVHLKVLGARCSLTAASMQPLQHLTHCARRSCILLASHSAQSAHADDCVKSHKSGFTTRPAEKRPLLHRSGNKLVTELCLGNRR